MKNTIIILLVGLICGVGQAQTNSGTQLNTERLEEGKDLEAVVRQGQGPGFGDEESQVERSQSSIVKLKQSTLVVKLNSNKRKIDELEKVLKSPSIGSNERIRLEAKLKDTKAETHLNNKAIVASFKSSFKFTDYLLMYDYDTPKMKKGERSGFFLNDDLEIDPSIELKKEKYFYAYEGNTNPTDGNQIWALKIQDQNFDDLQWPFPYAVDLTPNIFQIFRFGNEKSTMKLYKQAAKRLDKDLNRYYNKVTGLTDYQAASEGD